MILANPYTEGLQEIPKIDTDTPKALNSVAILLYEQSKHNSRKNAISVEHVIESLSQCNTHGCCLVGVWE